MHLAEFPEVNYLDLISKILKEGEFRNSRNGLTLSLFAESLEFDIGKFGFPLLTTKKVFFRGVVEELLWFIRGDTDAKNLAEKGVHIWDGNSSREYLNSIGLTDYEEFDCGPIYGFQWRNFGGEYPRDPNNPTGVDQLKDVIEQLHTNPTSRRMIISAWNPLQQSQMCLPACHTMYQFYKNEKGLSCQLMARSQDVILGTPFNIASTAVLTTLIAYVNGYTVDKIKICMGDCHVYENHITGAKQQIERKPFDFPKLTILKPAPIDSTTDEKIKWMENLTFEDFHLTDYVYHPAIKFEMVP